MCINSSFAPQSQPGTRRPGMYPRLDKVIDDLKEKYPILKVPAGCDLPEQGGITGQMGRVPKFPPFTSPINPNAEGIERYGINNNKNACWMA